MRALKRKLMSRRGASITFALLLFLVCAIISSVVIVAGTAAGGRLSQMAQMDQRYYAVNSAAELVKNVLEEQTATITLTTTTIDAGPPTKALTISENGTEISISDYYSVFLDAAKAMSSVYNEMNGTTSLSKLQLTLNANGSVDTTGLSVTVDLKNPSDQKLEMDVYNSNATTTNEKYNLHLTFAFDVKVSKDTTTPDESPVFTGTYDDEGIPIYHTPIKTITKQTEDYSCRLIKIQTGTVAAPTTSPGG